MVTAAGQAVEQSVGPAAAGLRETVSAPIADAVAEEVDPKVVERFGRVAVEEVPGTTDRKVTASGSRSHIPAAQKAVQEVLGTLSKPEAARPRGTPSTAARKAIQRVTAGR